MQTEYPLSEGQTQRTHTRRNVQDSTNVPRRVQRVCTSPWGEKEKNKAWRIVSDSFSGVSKVDYVHSRSNF